MTYYVKPLHHKQQGADDLWIVDCVASCVAWLGGFSALMDQGLGLIWLNCYIDTAIGIGIVIGM